MGVKKKMKIFYDVDTQNDFMNRDGALYVPDAEMIKPNLWKLKNYAIKNNISMVGSVDLHFGTEEYKEREGELAKYEGPFPDHCMLGTLGQEKIFETTLSALTNRDYELFNQITHAHDLKEQVYGNLLESAIPQLTQEGYGKQQLIFEKQSYDVFTNPAVEVFLDMAEVKEAVVYGVATDYCVKAAVLGMQERNIQTYVVEDAIKGVAEETTQQALEDMKQAGAKFVTTKQVLEELIK
jgi:nicotinamidase/pyrazinamidase